MTNEIRVLLAEDHPITLKGLRETIAGQIGMMVVAETADAQTTMEQILELKPEVAILDIYMPKDRRSLEPVPVAFQLARTIKQQQLSVGVIILTSHTEKEHYEAARRAGVTGYILKNNAESHIVAGVKAVAAGQHYVSPDISRYWIQRQESKEFFDRQYPGLKSLTATEVEVLRKVAEGKSSQMIAAERRSKEETINNHRSHICNKLGLEGPDALLRFVIQHKDEILRYCSGNDHPIDRD
jgi:DNA-binding NarL/FixJ family response regulator